MRGSWFFAFCMSLAGCGDAAKPAKPVTMTDPRLISGLRTCGIDPADATQFDERVNGKRSDYLVFSVDLPYPEPKMRCLARTLLRADYGVRRSGEKFDSAYGAAWNAEFPAFKRELGISWLREHRPGKTPPQFVPGKYSLGDFARELEKFCGAEAGTLLIRKQSLLVPWPEEEPQSECLLTAALAANPEGHGFSVQTPSYE